ncbi:hypothetical protein I4U23_016878 [Adineta vaga]|nr:hypothetical protein I4U23_016878 [Adineta vaga]
MRMCKDTDMVESLDRSVVSVLVGFKVGAVLRDCNTAYDHVYGDNYQMYEYNQHQDHHKASWTHELIDDAAGFAAMKAYEDHCRHQGEHVSHPFMKEMLAGLDFLNREQAKRRAIEQAHHLANKQYGYGGTFNYQTDPYGPDPNQYGSESNKNKICDILFVLF